MFDVEIEVEVDAPADEVFTFLADVENNPIWQENLRHCEWTSPGRKITEASTYDQESVFLGQRRVSTYVVCDYQPGRSITMETMRAAMPVIATRSVQPLDDRRCRVAAHVTGDLDGLIRLAAPLVRRAVARSMHRDYERLREHFAC